MSAYAIRQTVAVGNRCVVTDLPTAAPTVVRGIATYASSAKGGLCVLGVSDGSAPPKDGDSYTVRNAGVARGLRVSGNFGDAGSVLIYVGPASALRLIDTITPATGIVWAEYDVTILPDEVVAIADTGGGVTAARAFTVAVGGLAGTAVPL